MSTAKVEDHRTSLDAEVERLRAENERLRKLVEEADKCIFGYIYECPVRKECEVSDA